VYSSNCSSSKPVEKIGHKPDLISVPDILAFKTIQTEKLQQVEAMSPVTHVAFGTLRESPLYKPIGREGDSHFLAYPARPTVKKALKAFLKQKNSIEKLLWWVDTQVMTRYLKSGLRLHAYNL
jgi:hypothetical protein